MKSKHLKILFENEFPYLCVYTDCYSLHTPVYKINFQLCQKLHITIIYTHTGIQLAYIICYSICFKVYEKNSKNWASFIRPRKERSNQRHPYRLA